MTAVEKAIAETGKFVTNNILFETGKATLKPESMAEIQKVADYMLKNPSVRFEVQGHTDNQGTDKVNDPLSQQRAEAVVKALEGLGVDGFNLRAVGKGSHEPVADNKTEQITINNLYYSQNYEESIDSTYVHRRPCYARGLQREESSYCNR